MGFGSREWLDSLKIGSEVVLTPQYGLRSLEKITHATKTQIRIRSMKFSRTYGFLIGNGARFSTTSIDEPTPEIRAKIEATNLRERLERTDFRSLPLDKVRAILAVLDATESVI